MFVKCFVAIIAQICGICTRKTGGSKKLKAKGVVHVEAIYEKTELVCRVVVASADSMKQIQSFKAAWNDAVTLLVCVGAFTKTKKCKTRNQADQYRICATLGVFEAKNTMNMRVGNSE